MTTYPEVKLFDRHAHEASTREEARAILGKQKSPTFTKEQWEKFAQYDGEVHVSPIHALEQAK